MGYNTVVLVLNDALVDIQNDPDAGKKLASAIAKRSRTDGPVDVAIGSYLNAATVISTEHASTTVVVAVGQNYSKVLCYANEDKHEPLVLCRELAYKLGYRLSRIPSKNTRRQRT